MNDFRSTFHSAKIVLVHDDVAGSNEIVADITAAGRLVFPLFWVIRLLMSGQSCPRGEGRCTLIR
jgi:hypothetical protein